MGDTMKIGILTFIGVENCGALLQAYALNQKLKEFGNEVELINLISNNEYERKNKSSLKNRAFLARKIYYLMHFKSIKKRKIMFNKFREEYLPIYPKERKIYESELADICKKYNCLVCGSDQIWSQDPKLYDRSDAYFINFQFDGKRVSYAASFGDNLDYAEKNKNHIIPFIQKFDSVSVRETIAKEFLNNNDIKCEVTIDPTLLISKTEWEKISILPNIKEDYILYFSVNSRKYSINVAKKLSKRTGLKVIEINPHPKSWNSGFKKKYGIGPREFLGYILNAKYIVTNSFHGTVFSILFNKPFLAAFDEKEGKLVKENRKYTLLEMLKLQDCIMTESKMIDLSIINKICWEEINNNLENIKKESINYLKKNVYNGGIK